MSGTFVDFCGFASVVAVRISGDGSLDGSAWLVRKMNRRLDLWTFFKDFATLSLVSLPLLSVRLVSLRNRVAGPGELQDARAQLSEREQAHRDEVARLEAARQEQARRTVHAIVNICERCDRVQRVRLY